MFKGFTPQEKKVVLIISFAVVVRMLGLFLLLPVLSPYLKTLEGASPESIGLAIGIYGLAQALLQIPFGYLSDKYGRKPVIVFGMLSYALGSIMAGLVSNIWSMVFARFVQGFGAVSSAMVALSADLTREEIRTRAFATIGASIGLTFALSLVIAPPLAGRFGVPFIFFTTALLSLLVVFLIAFTVPEPKEHARDREIKPSLRNFSLLIKSKDQLFLNLSIALLHAYMVGIFTLVPYELVYTYSFPKVKHWEIYLPAVLLSMLLMVPAVIFAEKKKKFKHVFLAGILSLGFAFLVHEVFGNFLGLVLMVFFFFLGFHFLEPVVPSLLTRLTHKDIRGLSLGFFNTTQFLGAFLGGIWGGFALKGGHEYLTKIGLLTSIGWLILTLLWFRGLEDKL